MAFDTKPGKGRENDYALFNGALKRLFDLIPGAAEVYQNAGLVSNDTAFTQSLQKTIRAIEFSHLDVGAANLFRRMGITAGSAGRSCSLAKHGLWWHSVTRGSGIEYFHDVDLSG